MIKRNLLLFGFLLFCGAAIGQGAVSFTAETDTKEVVEGSVFEIYFTLKNATGQNFKAPNFKGFDVLSGPNHSMSTTIINGQVSSKTTLTYSLRAKKTGRYTIRPATISAGSKTLSTNPVQVSVIKARKPQAGKNGQLTADQEIFIIAELSDSVAYVGQQVFVNYKIYTTKNISALTLLSESDYGGVVNRNIERYNKQRAQVAVNGVQYLSEIIRRVAVFPQQTGTLEIDPVVYQIGIPKANEGDQRRSFLFRRNLTYEKKASMPVNIDVRPLPAGAPDDFCGAVGQYSMSSAVSPTNLSTDDALSVKIFLRGNGDPKQVLPPKIALPSVFDLYDPKVTVEESNEYSGEISHDKQFEWQALPEKTGRFSYTPTVSYFNPDSMKYITLSGNTAPLNIRQGTNQPRERIAQNEDTAKKELLPIKKSTSLKKIGSQFFGSPLFWLLFFAPGAVYAFLFYKKKKTNEADNIDPLERKKLRARKVAEKRLAKAKTHLNAGSPKEFYDEISDATFGYVCDKLNIPLSELNKSNLSQKLKEGGIPKNLIERFLTIIKTCEMALFAGKDNAAAMSETYDSTREVLAELEDLI